MWCSSQWRIGQLPGEPFVVCGSSVTPTNVVRDLGVWVDSGLTMSTHITKTVAGCFTTLRQLRSVRRSLSRDAFTHLVVALVLSRLDYCNGVLAGLPASQLNRLQSVRHASARLIYGTRQHDHVKPLLQRFHWLSVPERVEFKLCVLTYRCLHGLGPDYISSDFVSVSDLRSRQKLCSAIYCSFGGSSYTTFHTWRLGFSCYCC